MEKIAIILGEKYPVPVTLGGAVEILVESILKINEDAKAVEFFVFSPYEKKSYEISQDYKYSHFIFFKNKNIICDYSYKIIRRIVNRTLPNNYIPKFYLISVYSNLKSLGIKKVILENIPEASIYLNRKNEFYIYQHIHNEYVDLTNCFTKRIICTTQYFITVSNYIKSVILSMSPGTKVVTCYNGIDLSLFKKEKYNVNLAHSLNLLETDSVAIFVGRIQPHKGVKELILSFIQVIKQHKNFKLIIVGGAEFAQGNITAYVKELYKLANTYKENIIFTGYIPNNKIQPYLDLASLSIIPSLWNDPFPLSVLEALASSHGVITTDSGGIPEAINDKCAIIIKRDSNIVKSLSSNICNILSNKNKLEEMAQAAEKRAQEFSDIIMYNKFMSIITDSNIKDHN